MKFYYIIEAYSQLASNAVVITELELLRRDSSLIEYTVGEHFTTGNLSSFNGSGVWSKVKLSDGNFTYTNNSSGASSSASIMGSTVGSNHFARFFIITEEPVYKFDLYVGGPELRVPKYFRIYEAPSNDSNFIKTMDTSGLRLINQIDMDLTMNSVQKKESVNQKMITRKIIEINEPLSEDVFIQEGMKEITDWQELHEHNNELVCLTDFFGDDVEVLVYEEEPDEDNPLKLGITANYSPIDELKGEGELLIQTSREDILVEGMTTAPMYALSKKLKREDFLQMTDPFITGNGSIELSISEDLVNWQPSIQLKDLSVASVMSWPDTFYVRLIYKDCPRCFIGFMQLWDWQLISDSPIEQNSITNIIQHFYSGITEIPNHTLQISLNDGGSWTTIKEGIINEIAASVTQTGQMRLRVTGNKDQVIYPYSYSWTEIGGM